MSTSDTIQSPSDHFEQCVQRIESFIALIDEPNETAKDLWRGADQDNSLPEYDDFVDTDYGIAKIQHIHGKQLHLALEQDQKDGLFRLPDLKSLDISPRISARSSNRLPLSPTPNTHHPRTSNSIIDSVDSPSSPKPQTEALYSTLFSSPSSKASPSNKSSGSPSSNTASSRASNNESEGSPSSTQPHSQPWDMTSSEALQHDPDYISDIEILSRVCIAPHLPDLDPLPSEYCSSPLIGYLRHVEYYEPDLEGLGLPSTVLLIGTLYSEGVLARTEAWTPKRNTRRRPKEKDLQTESWYTLVLDPFHPDQPVWLIRDLLSSGWMWDPDALVLRKEHQCLLRYNAAFKEDNIAREFFDRLYNEECPMDLDAILPYEKPDQGNDMIKLFPSSKDWATASLPTVLHALFDKKKCMNVRPRLHPCSRHHLHEDRRRWEEMTVSALKREVQPKSGEHMAQ